MAISYLSPYYPHHTPAKYPSLWNGCILALNPSLGVTGMQVADLSGYGVNASWLGSPTLASAWTVTKGIPCVTTDGAATYLEAVVPQVVNLPTLTISGWIYRSAVGTKQAFGFGASSANTRLNILWFTDNKIYWEIVGSASAYWNTAGNTATGWHHLAMRYNGRINAPQLYLDGVEQTAAGNGGSTGDASTGSAAGITQFWVGREVANGFMTGSYTGLMVHNRQLSVPEIFLLATNPTVMHEVAQLKRRFAPSTGNRRRRVLCGGSA